MFKSILLCVLTILNVSCRTTQHKINEARLFGTKDQKPCDSADTWRKPPCENERPSFDNPPPLPSGAVVTDTDKGQKSIEPGTQQNGANIKTPPKCDQPPSDLASYENSNMINGIPIKYMCVIHPFSQAAVNWMTIAVFQEGKSSEGEDAALGTTAMNQAVPGIAVYLNSAGIWVATRQVVYDSSSISLWSEDASLEDSWAFPGGEEGWDEATPLPTKVTFPDYFSGQNTRLFHIKVSSLPNRTNYCEKPTTVYHGDQSYVWCYSEDGD